ncbi:MAG: hypothetical protein EOO38_00935, partial [Cytophagaceae bacterium]
MNRRQMLKICRNLVNERQVRREAAGRWWAALCQHRGVGVYVLNCGMSHDLLISVMGDDDVHHPLSFAGLDIDKNIKRVRFANVVRVEVSHSESNIAYQMSWG